MRVTKRAILAGAAALAVAAGACGGKATDDGGGNTGGDTEEGVGCQDTCGGAIANGEMLCAGQPGESFYQALQACACQSAPCAMACQSAFCAGEAIDIDAACMTCVQDNCGAQLDDCANN